MNQQTAACTLYRGTSWYFIYYFYNSYKSVLRTMYIVSYVQLTVIQQSVATTDYPPFYCNRRDCLREFSCTSGSKHTLKTWSSKGISFSVWPKKNSPVWVSRLDKYAGYRKRWRLLSAGIWHQVAGTCLLHCMISHPAGRHIHNQCHGNLKFHSRKLQLVYTLIQTLF